MATIADLVIGLDVKGASAVEAKFGKLGNTVDRLGQQAGKFLAAGLAVGGAAAVKMGQKASDLEETVSKASQIFGSQAVPALEKFAGAAAKNLGQSRQTALDAAATFGVFGKSAGLAGDDLVGFSTEMTTLASDMASFNNTSPEEAIEAIGAALRGESEPIRRFGVLLDDATLRQEAMRQGLVKTTKEALTPQQKVLAAQAAIMKQTSDQQGDFARTSDGLANKQRVMTAQFENLQVKLGTKVLPILLKLTDAGLKMINWIDRNRRLAATFAVVLGSVAAALFLASAALRAYVAISTIAAGVSKLVGSAAVKNAARMGAAWVAASARAVAAFTVMVARFVAQAALMAASMAAAAARTAAALAVMAAQFVAQGAVMAATMAATAARVVAGWVLMGIQALLNAARIALAWLIALGPIGLIIAAVIAVIAVFVLLWKRSQTFRKIVTAAVQGVWKAIKVAFNAVKAVVIAVFRFVVRFIQAQINAAIAVLKLIRRGVQFVVNAFGRMRAAVVARVRAVISFVRSIPRRIKSALGNLGRLLFSAGRNVIQGLINGIRSMLGAVGSAASSIASKIRGFLPFSPAKEGPLSGRGNPERSGATIPQMIAAGMLSGTGMVADAADAMLSAAGLGGEFAIGTPRGVRGGTRDAPVVRIVVDGADDDFKRLIRKMVRTDGRGDVQVAFG